jgi:ATP-binding cassette subfamily B protein
MNEIHSLESVEKQGTVNVLPKEGDLDGGDVSFRYEGPNSPWVIRHLDFKIKKGRTTIIVGPSGSGKTTLLNMLLNFYQPDEGIIKLGEVPLKDIQNSAWLEKCGVVQQDGHIFHDTIARNIALADEVIDGERLLEAARIANVLSFLDRFRDGFNTVIGEGGAGLSKGQKQCILIARAVYKRPEYLFLDEATNDLDAENERLILERLQHAFRGKTLVFIANRMNPAIRMDEVLPLSAPTNRTKPAPSEWESFAGGNGKHGSMGEQIIFN